MMLMDMVLLLLVILPVTMAVIFFIFSESRHMRAVVTLVQSGFVALSFFLLWESQSGPVITAVGGYYGFLGILLQGDSLSSAFVFLTAIMFLMIILHNLLSRHEPGDRFYWFLMFILQGSLNGLFLSRDFFNIFVLVEVSTVVVTILLMYDRNKRNLLAGMIFIMINILAMQFYLFGMGYLYMLTGVLDLEAAAAQVAYIDNRDLVLPYALIMTSIAAKCSLLPLLTWSPKVGALTGSRFTIAALMSGLHAKAGVYMFIRIQPVFGGMGDEFFLWAGVATAFGGVILALAQKDIRLMLAYSTVAQVGLIIVGMSLHEGYSRTGSLLHIVNHAIIKAALFLAAGMFCYRYKTKDITKIRGLFRLNPVLAVSHFLAVLGIMGAPFFNGGLSKYFLAHGATGFTEWIIVAINFGTVLVFVRYSAIFFGQPQSEPEPGRNGRLRLAVLMCVGIFCVVMGVFGGQAAGFLFGETMQVDFVGYGQKNLIFIASLIVAIIVYRKILAGRDIFKPLHRIQCSFKSICISIGLFFVALAVYVGTI